jgi:acetyl esterase
MVADRTERDEDELMRRMLAEIHPPASVHELRVMSEAFAPRLNARPPHVGRCHDDVLIARHGDELVTCDIIAPAGDPPWPILVYYHGGGWVAGSSRTHRKIALRYAEAGYLAVNVNYRLAPEHPFPTPWQDCLDAIEWVIEHGSEYGGDATRLITAGDSAGANLAASTAIERRVAGSVPHIAACLLFYGVFDAPAALSDPMTGSRDPMITSDVIRMFANAYLGPDAPPDRIHDRRITVTNAAEQLPPSFVTIGSNDPLLPQSRELVRRVSGAAIPHEFFIADGMPHGFMQLEFFAPAREAMARSVAFLSHHV